MIEHLFTVLCRDASVDRDTNNITLSRVFTRLQIPQPRNTRPGTRANADVLFYLVTAWGRADPEAGAKATAYVDILDPNEDLLFSATYDVDLTDSEIHHQRIEVALLPITGSGRYLFRVGRADVKDQGRTKHFHHPEYTAPLDVTIADPDDAAMGSGD